MSRAVFRSSVWVVVVRDVVVQAGTVVSRYGGRMVLTSDVQVRASRRQAAGQAEEEEGG